MALIAGGLLVAWVGVWGAWIAHPSAGLTQSALDLAQVAQQRLPDVLYGQQAFIPDLLRLSIALSAIALSIVADDLNRSVYRWVLRGLSLLLVIRMLPPYPAILDFWRSSEYGSRFVIASLALLAMMASLGSKRWSAILRMGLLLVLNLGALAGSLWVAEALRRSFESATQLAFSIGWGLALYSVGVGWALLHNAGALVKLRRSQSTTA